MRSNRGATRVGSFPATPSLPTKPGTSWICTPGSGAENHSVPSTTAAFVWGKVRRETEPTRTIMAARRTAHAADEQGIEATEVAAWAAGLRALHARIADGFARAEPRRRALAY